MKASCTGWRHVLIFCIGACALTHLCVAPAVAQSFDAQQASDALGRAVDFYRTEYGYQGAYLWRSSADLENREGENKAHRTSGWTQPPGTPAVGEAYLTAWRLCGDSRCLEAAREAAMALVRSQLHSGGWDSRFELAEEHRRRYAYRVDGSPAGKRNVTTLDDHKTQSALRLLMRVDEALEFQDPRIHSAVEYALDHLLAAQYACGAWPQRFSEPPDQRAPSSLRASYPDEWSWDYPDPDYARFYTLNDNNHQSIVEMLMEADRIYQRDDCYRAAVRTGDFLLAAQMPQPQPGWAQQYDAEMHPAWARKFEPPAVTGGESQGVMRTLVALYRQTGEQRFLEPIPRALEYFRHSRLPDGRLARFYELRTNRPLYVNKDLELTYSDDDLRAGYGFKVSANLDAIERAYQQALGSDAKPRRERSGSRPRVPAMRPRLKQQAEEVAASLDARGAWVEEGTLRDHGQDDETEQVIESKTFIKNLETLARFIAAAQNG